MGIKPKTKSINGLTIAYREGTIDELVFGTSFDGDIFFTAAEYKPASNHVIIDIGAHIGLFSLHASSLVPKGIVYAIEPCKGSFDYLKKNISLNKITNIIPCNIALASERKRCKLYYSPRGNWGNTIVKNFDDSYEVVSCDTLENFMVSNDIKECNFMKVNCEGAEFPIILNTPEKILIRFEIIVIAYHCDFWEDNTEVDIDDYLTYCGFKVDIKQASDKRGMIIARL